MTAMLENIRNAITRLPMDWLWRNLGGHIPSYSRHVSHDAVAMATAVGRCLATAHCTFSSYGRLEAECVNKICWNLVYNSKLGPQWQSRDQILKFLKLKMADGRHVWKYSKCHNQWTDCDATWVVTSHHVLDMSAMVRLPWQRPLPSNSALKIQQLWASGGRTRKPILLKFGVQQQIRTTMTVTWSNIKIFKIQNGGRPPCCKIFETP